MKRRPPKLDPPLRRHRPVSDEEKRLWEETVDESKAPSSAPPASPRIKPRGVAAKLSKTRTQSVSLLDRPSLLALRKEQSFEATLDLHGMTQEDAYAALTRFLSQMQAHGVRIVLVITGKGRGGEGVLRREFPRWLKEKTLKTLVSAYHPAGLRHGGDGAWYVRIRKP